MEKLLYRVEEVAELTSRGRTETYREIKEGRLRSVKIGRRRLVPADALREYAELLSAGAR